MGTGMGMGMGVGRGRLRRSMSYGHSGGSCLGKVSFSVVFRYDIEHLVISSGTAGSEWQRRGRVAEGMSESKVIHAGIGEACIV